MTFLPAEAPRLGLGLAALGRPGYINLGHGADLADRSVDGLRAQAWAVLDEAWAAGVRYFDTARSYGLGEAFLGGWLAARGLGPGPGVRVGSKWGTRTSRTGARTHRRTRSRPTTSPR